MKPKTPKELDRLVADCIGDMKEPIVELAKKYPAEIINGAMLELSLRMILLQHGTTQALHMLAATTANLLEKGPMIEAYVDNNNDIDESDWLKNGSLVKPTIH